MRASISFLMFGALCAAGVAVAAEPAVTPPDAYVKALQAAPCPGALHRGANGICPAVSGQAEGFSLFDAPSATSTARPMRDAAPRKMQGVVRTRVATATPIHSFAPPAATSGALSDLLITFKYESAELTDHGKAQAHSFAQALLDPSLLAARVEISGHCDASGNEEKNLVLSEARAEAVKAYMVSQGVDPSRLTTKGYGSRDLAVPASPLDAANRRVEARRLD